MRLFGYCAAFTNCVQYRSGEDQSRVVGIPRDSSRSTLPSRALVRCSCWQSPWKLPEICLKAAWKPPKIMLLRSSVAPEVGRHCWPLVSFALIENLIWFDCSFESSLKKCLKSHFIGSTALLREWSGKNICWWCPCSNKNSTHKRPS